MWLLNGRLEINGPQWGSIYLRTRTDERNVPVWTLWGIHGGDEYGNCSIYLISPLIGGLVFFYELPSHFQRKVLLPEDVLTWEDIDPRDLPQIQGWFKAKGY
jgi:hypothetical protein